LATSFAHVGVPGVPIADANPHRAPHHPIGAQKIAVQVTTKFVEECAYLWSGLPDHDHADALGSAALPPFNIGGRPVGMLPASGFDNYLGCGHHGGTVEHRTATLPFALVVLRGGRDTSGLSGAKGQISTLLALPATRRCREWALSGSSSLSSRGSFLDACRSLLM